MDTELATIKEAETEFPIHELIKKRWSPRAFSDKNVEPDLLRRLFDAARWAPSSYNEQPWRFIYAAKSDAGEYEKLSRVLNEFNAKWATGAPVLLLTIVKQHFEGTGKPNRLAEHDTGAAMSYLTFEATANDLYVHQMAGILPDKARELYHIPEGYKPYTMAAIGYLGDPGQLPEDLRNKERGKRSRLEIDDVAFKGSWENS